jgi:hypothetical protein
MKSPSSPSSPLRLNTPPVDTGWNRLMTSPCGIVPDSVLLESIVASTVQRLPSGNDWFSP